MTYYWYGALSQKTYPGVGDLDDCWVVASIWAMRYQTRQTANLPTATQFRIAAGNPDNPWVADGGNHNQISQAVKRLWPTVTSVNYQSYDFGPIDYYLRHGGSVSLAVKASDLPSTMQYGFGGPHQIGVVYRDGYKVMNPLAPNGTAPQPIGHDRLVGAAKALNGQVQCVAFPHIALGTIRVWPRRLGRWERTPYGTWIRHDIKTTAGFTGIACPPKKQTVDGRTETMILVSTGGGFGGYWVKDIAGVTYKAPA